MPAHPQSRVDLGLLILRIGLGVMFVFHGLTKLLGGPEVWRRVGGAMHTFGIDFWAQGWGFTAGLIECLGGIAVAIGLVFRPACALLALVMLIATTTKFGDPALGFWLELKQASHPIELLIVFAALVWVGAGRWALDRRYRMTLTNRYQRPAGSTPAPQPDSGVRRSSITTELDDEWE